MMQRLGRRLISNGLSARLNQSRKVGFLHHQVSKRETLKVPLFGSSHSLNPVSSDPFGTKTRTQISNFCSSQPASETDTFDAVDALVEPLSAKEWGKETVNYLESLDLVWNNPMASRLLRRLDANPTTALSFFNWVSPKICDGFDSAVYSLMLEMLVMKGHMQEFWDLLEEMKKAGHRMYKGTRIKIRKKFSDENMVENSVRLDEFFGVRVRDDLIKLDDEEFDLCNEIVKLVERKDEWDEQIEQKLQPVSSKMSENLVISILKMLKRDPMKALMFFQGLEEKLDYKHNKAIYNSMVSILGRRDCMDSFWFIVNAMRDSGREIEVSTYENVSRRFQRRKLLKEAVDLYEFMLAGPHKVPDEDGVFILRRIVVSKVSDWDLFDRVVRIMNSSGLSLTKTAFDSIIKSLSNAGKFREVDKVMKSMRESGFVVGSNFCGKAVSALCEAGKLDEAFELFDELVIMGYIPDLGTMVSTIRKHCVSGRLDMASSIFKNMVKRDGIVYPDSLEVLVNAFFDNDKAVDAMSVVTEAVNSGKVRPSHNTFKALLQKLASQGKFEEAGKVLGLMKSQGFPPFLDPLVECISKFGTADNALGILKAMTVKDFPATAVFLRMFQAFSDAGRYQVAQDLLYKSPSYIRNHADVLDLFSSMKHEVAVA